MNATANDLQVGFQILWYQIVSVLGRGGFGITYLARDNNLGQLVAIKEYLPHDFATRSSDSTVQPVSIDQHEIYKWGLQRFMTEAQTLARFKHPNIVRVHSVFKQNNTGYMVMEYEQGEDLSDVYKRKKQLTQQELQDAYYPIIKGLALVHEEGFIHRDIKPSNIFIRSDGSPVLIDFGAARQAVGGKTRALTSMLSVGYAPFEQYNDTPGKQGAWTDIYALGASMYQGITGEKPLESTIRGMALIHDEADPYQPLSIVKPAGYSLTFLRAIDQALMIQIQDRPQTLGNFMEILNGNIELADLALQKENDTEATVIRQRTVIRPVDQKNTGAEITQPEPITDRVKKLLHKLKELARQASELAKNLTLSYPILNSLSQRKTIIAMALTLGVIVIGLIVLSKEKTTEEINRANIESLIKKAQQQISSQQFYNKSGDGAINSYQKILKIEQNNASAKQGITQVASLMLLQTQAYIERKNFDKAREQLLLINKLAPDLPRLKETQQKYSTNLEHEKTAQQLELLLIKANAALENGQLYEPEQDNAFFYYQHALTLDSENKNARLGLLHISNSLTEKAQSELDKNNSEQAEKLLTLAKKVNPDNPSLEPLYQQAKNLSELTGILSEANKAYKRLNYTSPKNFNAYDLYTKALSLSASNREAKEGLNKIAQYYSEKTHNYIESGDLKSAQEKLNILQQYFPEYQGIAELKSGLSNKRIQINTSHKISNKSIAKTDPIPSDVNQKQDDYQIVQDIVGKFITAFKSRSIKDLLRISQMSQQQIELYRNIFNTYKSFDLILVPNSFKLTRTKKTAGVKFEITDLIDANGNTVITSANWTKLELKIIKKNINWLKAEVL